MIKLSDDQKKVHDAAVEWFKGDKPTSLRIGGFAGCGKTVLTAQIAKTIRTLKKPPKIAFCCFTGKAAYVLQTKLRDAQALNIDTDYVGTIHGLMYEPVIVGGQVINWRRRTSIDAGLLIVDEASMVGEQIWRDLQSYNIPILAVGDHGQLPPVGSTFNLMENPDHTLTKIHRQAEGNPIIRISRMAREEGAIPLGNWGNDGAYARKIESQQGSLVDTINGVESILFLCGRNRTRTSVNARVRARLGYRGDQPLPGERVICLKNNRETGIFNGMGGMIKKIDASDKVWYDAKIDMDDGTAYKGRIVRDQFGADATLREHKEIDPRQLKDLFDWGYCLTVHKAQGSEADNVVLFEERFSQSTDGDWRRWLYTGVTRARKKLLIVGG